MIIIIESYHTQEITNESALDRFTKNIQDSWASKDYTTWYMNIHTLVFPLKWLSVILQSAFTPLGRIAE